jgi:hypothetical protein
VSSAERANETLDRVLLGLKDVVVANYASQYYEGSNGLSIWFPKNNYTFMNYAERYENLDFNRKTSWIDLLRKIYQ